jgi:protein phosphatase
MIFLPIFLSPGSGLELPDRRKCKKRSQNLSHLHPKRLSLVRQKGKHRSKARQYAVNENAIDTAAGALLVDFAPGQRYNWTISLSKGESHIIPKRAFTPSLYACWKSHIGHRRRRNEDSLLILEGESPEAARGSLISYAGSLYAVADGMGGHPAGDIASQMVCQELKAYFMRPAGLLDRIRLMFLSGRETARLLERELIRAVDSAQRRLCCHERGHRECSGLGTTLSVLLLSWPWAIWGNVGDSRIYRLRQGRLRQLTTDDTWTAEMLRDGDITQEELSQSPFKNVLTQALGGGFERIHTGMELGHEEDTYLISSDGLHDMVPDEEIQDIVATEPISKVCRVLTERALARGGRDNVTVIVIHVSR